MRPSDAAHSRTENAARLIELSMTAGLPGPTLGLRLLALAAVAGSGVFLPVAIPARLSLTAGILAGALIGFLQYVTTRRRYRVPGELFVVAQVMIWTFMVQATGGQHSPLFAGYLLEIPLSAALLSRRGILLAGIAAAAAYLGTALVFNPPLDTSAAAVALGFLAVTAVLSWLLVEVVERQQRLITASRAALTSRAENLAEELRLLGDYLNGALIGLDEMGRVSSINQAGLEMLGLEHPAALGRPWQEVLRPDPAGAQAIARTLSDGTAQRALSLVLEDRAGRRVAVAGELWVAPSPSGRRTHLLLSTAPPGTPDADPLRRLGEATACVSHQIKNSLHALQGFTHRIQEELGPETDRSEPARQLLKALHSLGELADDVLAISGSPRPAGEVVPVGDILASAVVLARAPESRVQVNAPLQGLLVRGHRGQLVHALFNLVDNACRVSPPGAVVEVRAQGTGDRVHLEIRDAGPGMPEDLKRPNARARSSNGSGYGLLAARRFIESNGGQLDFEGLPGGGTLCRVSLVAADTGPAADR
jgi:signal transduction histidine kinase